MKCPVDNSDMIVFEFEKIELDYCIKCSGIWFDATELELLVNRIVSKESAPSASDVLCQNKAEVAEARRKCSICRRQMDKVWLCDQPKVLVDKCPRGDGLWFDGGELAQVLKQIPLNNASGINSVISFMKNAIKVTG